MSSSLSGDTCRIFWLVLRANPAGSLTRIIHENIEEPKGHSIFAHSRFAPRNLPSPPLPLVKGRM
jgi:hypothetical protein